MNGRFLQRESKDPDFTKFKKKKNAGAEKEMLHVLEKIQPFLCSHAKFSP